jgi:hypothetical protein
MLDSYSRYFPKQNHCIYDLLSTSATIVLEEAYLLVTPIVCSRAGDKALLGNKMLGSRARSRELTAFCYVTS